MAQLRTVLVRYILNYGSAQDRIGLCRDCTIGYLGTLLHKVNNMHLYSTVYKKMTHRQGRHYTGLIFKNW